MPLSGRVVAGVVVGSVLASLSLAVLLWVAWSRHRRREKTGDLVEHGPGYGGTATSSKTTNAAVDSQAVDEVDDPAPRGRDRTPRPVLATHYEHQDE
ncbi:hypothetical protein CPLU01_15250 [Colletotrichum plurivorum]|uniref:Uncharacterized protein n=1 Tax=Colletotrichum plurivorum TaxID=2175906 RepID=A0A8H6MWE1_9PEZI|nr:hypothetical protein CPLU01_15250 [Colletotrichum plurivorum]